MPEADKSPSVLIDQYKAQVDAFIKEEVQDAPTRVRTTPIVKSVLQRVAKETVNSQAIVERTQSKVKQAAVNQYLNKASSVMNNIIANRTSSRSPSTPTQALLVAALAASAYFNAQHVDNKRLAGRRFPKLALEVAMAVMCADTGTMMKYC